LILSADNPVVADALGASVMGIPTTKVGHILMAEKENLGITDLSKVTMNDDWTKFRMHFEVNKTMIDTLSWALFNSETCAKVVMNSPLTPLIYGVATKFRNPDEQNVADELKK
jgi:hypothetical protein